MDLDSAIAELRTANEPVPLPMRLPTLDEVAAVESELGLQFHPDFRTYLLKASDVVCGTIEPVTITIRDSHTDIRSVVANARAMGVGPQLIPICEDNADFYCVTPEGEVVFWSHNGWAEEKWDSIAAWIEQVWLESC